MSAEAHSKSAPLRAETEASSGALRRLLDSIYGGAAAMAGLCMVGVLVMVLLSILGRQLGFLVRGTDAYSGYFTAAAGFLALAHTFKRGEHIRVTLLLNALKGNFRRALELWSIAAASALTLLLAYYSVRLCLQSFEFNDVSSDNDATPLWLPQLSMAVGTVVLAIAFIDELILELRGKRISVQSDEPLRIE